jgi:hemoglobin
MSKQRVGVWIVAVIVVVVMSGARGAFAEETSGETLYARLGGLMPISVVVSDFIDAIVPDETLNMNPAIDEARTRVPAPYLKYHVTAMVCQATGGPCTYEGRNMKDSHAHLNISGKDWDRMVTIFKETLAKHGVPAKEAEELLAIVGSTRADIVTR